MAPRNEQEQTRQRHFAAQRAARRRRRLGLLSGTLIVAAAVVVAAIAISSSASSGLLSGRAERTAVAQVNGLLAGIPQSGNGLGDPSAPVKLYYYGDLECPVCRDFTLSSFPSLVAGDVRAGRVQVIYRAFETATRDPQVFQLQQVAALAAGVQNRFWDFAELFYRQQGGEGTGYATEGFLDRLARQVPGLDYARWLVDRRDPALIAQVQANVRSGRTDNVQGTPTLVAHGARGRRTAPGLDPGTLHSTISAVA